MEKREAMIETEMQTKMDNLRNRLKEMGSVVIAFSGGVDSTFLLKVAVDTLGKGVLAVTATSSTYPLSQQQEAIRLANQIGARQILVKSEELEINGFASNPPNRCYFCKKELFGKLLQIAREQGVKYILDGSNFDDLNDYRPGMQAAQEIGVRSPLKEIQLTKDDIRKLSKELGLPTWNKPSYACLSSRFPYGITITKEKLRQVDRAESYLRRILNAGQVRVRYHNEIARIETTRDAFSRMLTNADAIVKKLREYGFIYITLDLQGYRTGSMNETLLQKFK